VDEHAGNCDFLTEDEAQEALAIDRMGLFDLLIQIIRPISLCIDIYMVCGKLYRVRSV